MRTEYKGYYIAPDKTAPSIYSVATTGRGGKVPDVLSGLFTTRVLAMKEIDRYISTRKVKNDEAVDQS